MKFNFEPILNLVSNLGEIWSGFSTNKSNERIAKENREFQEEQFKIANQINIDEAEKNRLFQERLSNTSYQRGVEDMRQAGISPMLAYMKGGASTPSGSAGSAGSVPAGSTALMNKVFKAELMYQLANSALAVKERRKDIALKGKQLEVIDKQLPAIEAESKYNSEKANLNKRLLILDAIYDRIMPVVKTAGQFYFGNKLLNNKKQPKEYNSRLWDGTPDKIYIDYGSKH